MILHCIQVLITDVSDSWYILYIRSNFLPVSSCILLKVMSKHFLSWHMCYWYFKRRNTSMTFFVWLCFSLLCVGCFASYYGHLTQIVLAWLQYSKCCLNSSLSVLLRHVFLWNHTKHYKDEHGIVWFHLGFQAHFEFSAELDKTLCCEGQFFSTDVCEHLEIISRIASVLAGHVRQACISQSHQVHLINVNQQSYNTSLMSF